MKVALVMLGNLYLCLMVMACVMLTLVDVVGTLHFWDVTIGGSMMMIG